ncbi:MAG: succinylglutamate desuccinylase/aspartoacylase family protein [Legionellaceae bacterium]|nr:succinylglutamate desuccinylase/aspartoacylase family protein [Legionellaceae bacterium]
MEDLVIGGEVIKPGHKKTIYLGMPKLYDWTPMAMPVHVLRGKHPGPTLCITAAIHGDEINGTEIIRRLLKKISLSKLKGTIIAIPIVNIYGFLYQERYLMDRRDLNRSFPGSKSGSLASRLANILAEEILANVTHAIDLHTGSHHRTNLPQIRGNLDMPCIRDLACAFNVPVVLHSSLKDGSFRQYANDLGIPFLLYEAGEALRFDEFCIRTGINGILRVMNKLDMYPHFSGKAKKIEPTISYSSYWVRGPVSGILRAKKKLGDKVIKGQLLGIIANPTSTDEQKIRVPNSGIIIGESKIPLVHAGAALYHIATFEKLDLVEEQLEYMKDVFDNETKD